MSTGTNDSPALRAALESLVGWTQPATRDLESGRSVVLSDLVSRLLKLGEAISGSPTAKKWLNERLKPCTAWLAKGSPLQNAVDKYFETFDRYESKTLTTFMGVWKALGKEKLSDSTPQARMDLLKVLDKLLAGVDGETQQARCELDRALHDACLEFDWDRYYGMMLMAFPKYMQADSTGNSLLIQDAESYLENETDLLPLIRSLDRCASELREFVGDAAQLPADTIETQPHLADTSSSQLTLEERAIALLVANKTLTIVQIAGQLGVDRKTPYKWKRFMVIFNGIKDGPSRIRRGEKDAETGEILAYD